MKRRETVATLFCILFLLLVIVLGGCGGGGGSSSGTSGTGGTISLAWDAPTIDVNRNQLMDLAGYKLHYGTASGVYDHSVDVGNVTTYTLTGLTKGQVYYIYATAYDTSSNESSPSNSVSGAAK